MGRADFLELLRHFTPQQVIRLAESQGFVVKAEPERARAPETAGAEANRTGSAAAGPTARPLSLPLWRLVAVEWASRRWISPVLDEQLTSADRYDPERRLTWAPPTPPVEPWSRLGPRIEALVTTARARHALDVPRAVRTLSRGQPLRPPPRLHRSSWPDRLHLWFDRSEHLLPVWNDQSQVYHQLARLLGASALRFEAFDSARLDALEAGSARLTAVQPGETVLLLGDLGPDDPQRARWLAVGEALVRRGAQPVAIGLVDGEAGAWRVAPWTTESLTAQATERLLVLVSLVAAIPPGLLRALRQLLPEAGLADELAVWNGAPALARDALVLDRTARTPWQAQFAQLPESTRESAAALVRQWHARLPTELAAVQTLTWEIWGGGARVGDRGEALALLRRVAGSLTRADEPAWRHFAQRACECLPVEAADAEVASVVQRLARAAAASETRAAEPELVEADEADRRLSRRYAVHQIGDALVFPPTGDAWPSEHGRGSPLAWLDAFEPWVAVEGHRHPLSEPLPLGAQPTLRLVSDRQVLTFDSEPAPPWATAAGRDHLGLWADLELGGVAQRLRWIPPGRFLMGSPESEAGRWADEGPQHPVTIDHGFWLADTPVTQALWQAVMGENPSRFKGLERPVERVSWQDAQGFLERAKVAGLGLPTEAQWEYACRAGTPTATWRGDDPAVRAEIAWFDENSRRETQPVKTKPANPLGLYDMFGNVWQWCADPWRQSYASTARESAASERVVRGGAWGYQGRSVRAAFRDRFEPADRLDDLGFRLALQPAKPVAAGGAAPGGRHREAKPRGRRP